MKTNTRHLLTLAVLLGFTVPTWAQTSAVPDQISYQGVVTDAGGNPIGNVTPENRTVVFRIWDHATNTAVGNLIYSEQQVVTISKGEFSVLVGDGTAVTGTPLGYSETTKGKPTVTIPTAFGGTTRFIGVSVYESNGNVAPEISPRQRVVSSAYAYRARFAESVGANGTTALTTLNGGQVGIGNTNPPALFTVSGANTSTSTSTPQMIITADDVTERLRLGVDSTGNGSGFIQSFKEGIGAQNLLLNPNGGNVGIGTTTPNHRLQVHGNLMVGTAAPALSFTPIGDTLYLGQPRKYLSTTLGTSVGGSIDWLNLMCHTNSAGILFGGATSDATPHSNPAVYMVIKPGGNVGIGATAPSSPLFVTARSTTSPESNGIMVANPANSANNHAIMALRTQGSGGNPMLAFDINGVVGYTIGIDNTDDRLKISRDWGAFSATMMTFTNVGNVGIGTSVPSALLSLGSGLANTKLALFDTGTTLHGLGVQGSQFRLHTGAPSDRFSFLNAPNGTEIMSVLGNGNVGIGTSSPAAKLHVKATSDNNIGAGLRLEHATDSDYWSIFPENTNNRLIFMFGNQYPGGNYALLSPTASGFITVSDARTKKDIEVIRGSLAKVMLLAPKTYRFKSAEAGTPLNYGFMAQEVERVYPDLVTESHGMKALATNSLIAINTQAIQELKTEKDAELKALKSEIFELKAQLAKIQAKDKARDAKLAAIEKLLLTAGKAAAQPVSLRKTASGAE